MLLVYYTIMSVTYRNVMLSSKSSQKLNGWRINKTT